MTDPLLDLANLIHRLQGTLQMAQLVLAVSAHSLRLRNTRQTKSGLNFGVVIALLAVAFPAILATSFGGAHDYGLVVEGALVFVVSATVTGGQDQGFAAYLHWRGLGLS